MRRDPADAGRVAGRRAIRRRPDARGFSLHRAISDEAELLLLAVAPDYRRRGIGRMLLDQFMDNARDRGASRVHLEVREGNPAVIMYRSAGFTSPGAAANIIVAVLAANSMR